MTLSIRKIGVVSRAYRHINRYRQILTILFKYGFGDLVDSLQVDRYIEISLRLLSLKRKERLEALSRPERVRMALEELGPTFIKMGQILSTRPDLIPVEFIAELEKLQDQVPPFSYADARRIVETELKVPLEDVFQSFSEVPLAAASIGQVHRAKLKGGEDVAVKVQRPGIGKIIEVDLEIILHIATLMERHLEEGQIYRPIKIVEEFSRTLEKEIDYTIEISNMERFAGQFFGEQTVYVPKVYREVSTERVITMEYIAGIKASEIEHLKEAGRDLKIVAVRGADLILKQVFDYGFFHADPHPGNVFIMCNDVVCYLDFGMMGHIGRRMREDFVDLLSSIVRRDESAATEALLGITDWEEEPDHQSLERDVADFMGQHLYRPLGEMKLGKLLQQLLGLISRHHLRIPPDLFLMMKALAAAEEMGRLFDPDFDMIERIGPFIRSIKLARLHPQRLVNDAVNSGTEFLSLLKEIPGEMREILRQARQGKIGIKLEHRGLKSMLRAHDRISNRISFAIVLASLVIGSSLIVLSGVAPLWHGVSVIGIVGFVGAGLIGFWLLLSVLRKGGL